MEIQPQSKLLRGLLTIYNSALETILLRILTLTESARLFREINRGVFDITEFPVSGDLAIAIQFLAALVEFSKESPALRHGQRKPSANSLPSRLYTVDIEFLVERRIKSLCVLNCAPFFHAAVFVRIE